MKNILRIYKRDLKNIFTNWVALVIVIATIILPSLYAWFNIKASWDPYSNTGGIKVAVVNMDEGGVFKDTDYNIGDRLVDKLEDNTSFGWQFVSKEEADRGVLEGDYYASIEVPEDFTQDILSLADHKIKRPSLIYNVNEKSNAIVPKITNTGVNTVKGELNSNIVKVVNGVIFNVFDQVGITAEDNKYTLRNVVDDLYELNDRMPEIEEVLNEASDGLVTLDTVIYQLNEVMPKVEDTILQGQALIKSGQSKTDDIKRKADKKSDRIKTKLEDAQDAISGIQSSIKDKGGKATKVKLVLAQKQVDLIDSRLKYILDELNELKKLSETSGNNSNLDALINQITELQKVTSTIQKDIEEALKLIKDENASGETISNAVNAIDGAVNNLKGDIDSILDSYDAEVVSTINEVYDSINNISNNGTSILETAEDTIPDINYLLDLAAKDSALGQEELNKIKEKFPAVKEKLNTFVEKLKEYDNGEDFDDLVDLLINDSDESSSFMSDVIKIEKNSIFEVPNYGSAMSPFYSTLALWVGGTILVSLLTTHAKKFDDGTKIKPHEEYFGKGLTFLSIAAIQGFVVTFGDICLLGTYAVHPILFILIGILISIVFVGFIYTLVSVFGNVGKALAIIFLVLQVAASGGTFPVEVMSGFFQMINPLLPFKYAIGLMRETSAGIVEILFIKNLLYLLIYLVIALIMGVGLKKFVNTHTKKFTVKLEESGIAGH